MSQHPTGSLSRPDDRHAALDCLQRQVWSLGSSSELPRLLSLVSEALSHLAVPWAHVGVVVVEPAGDDGPPRLRASLDVGDNPSPPAEVSRPGHDALLRIWSEGRLRYRRDLDRDDPFGERRAIRESFGKPIRSVVDVPFATGILAVNSCQPDAFSDADLDALRDVARILDGGLQRWAQLRELEGEARRAATVARLRRALWMIQDPREGVQLNQVLVECLQEAGVEFSHCGLNPMRVEPSGQLLTFSFVLRRWVRVERELEAEHFRRILRTGRACYRPDLKRDDPLGEREVLARTFRQPIRSVVDVPFSRGTFAVNHTRPDAFSERDLAALRELAGILDESLGEALQRLEDLRILRDSQEHFRRIAEGLDDVIYSVDARTEEYLYLSPAFERLTGYSEADIAAGGGRRAFLESVASLIEEPEVQPDRPAWRRQVWRLRRKDGSLCELEDCWTDRRQTDPDILAEGILHDVTVRRREERSLRIRLALSRLHATILEMETEDDWRSVIACLDAELRELIDYEHCGVCVVDLEADVFDAYNPRTYHARRRVQPVPAALRRAVETQKPVYRRSREEILFWQDHTNAETGSILDVPFSGGTVSINSRVVGAFDQAHVDTLREVADVLAQGRRRLDDLKALREREEALRQARAMEVVGQFAGGVAHDFNNMLSAILSSVELARGRPGERGDRELDTIETAARRAASLTQKLLAFGRRQPTKLQDLDLNEQVQAAADLVRRLIGEQVRLTLDLHPDAGWVRFDETQLTQILLNLAINGRDAMAEAGGELRVETGRIDREGRAQPFVRVCDEGVGMDAQILAHAFEPFYTTKPEGQGSGMGLATVYGVVSQAGGQLDVDSRPGAGTRVTVSLPSGSPPGPSSPAGASTDAPAAAAGTGQRLLLVEDEEIVRRSLAAALEASGYRVQAASCPEEALRLCAVADAHFDVILSDLVMPGMRGSQMLEHLRPRFPAAVTVLMTGYDPEGESVDAADLVLAKPIPLRRLLAVLSERLSADADRSA